MKNYLPFLLIILICSFIKKDDKSEAELKANEVMEWFNEHKIPAKMMIKVKVGKDSVATIYKSNY